MKPRVLVVDDSSYVRMAVGRALASQGLDVVGYARDGEEAIERNLELEPDLILLDLQMPVLDGVGAVRRIQATRPTPTLVFASMDPVGAELAVQALAAGALDVVPKPSTEELTLDLAARVWAVAGAARMRRPPGARLRPPKVRIVVVASSTGGPPDLEAFLQALPASFPVPIVVAQHMLAGFTGSLAARLDRLCELRVFEAAHGDKVGPGAVALLPGGCVGTVQGASPDGGGRFVLSINCKPTLPGAKPNASALFFSALGTAGEGTCAIVLTGMGADGADAVRALVAEGAPVIAQDPSEAVISSMPNAAIAAGAQHVEPLRRIPARLLRMVARQEEAA